MHLNNKHGGCCHTRLRRRTPENCSVKSRAAHNPGEEDDTYSDDRAAARRWKQEGTQHNPRVSRSRLASRLMRYVGGHCKRAS